MAAAVVFIVPLIAVVFFDQLRAGWLAAFVAIAVSSLGLGILFSLHYWRYPFAQPRLLAQLRNISVVEQLSFVSGVNSAKELAPRSQQFRRSAAQMLQWNTATEIDAIQRILQVLGNRKIPIESQQPVSPELVASIWQAADDAELLIDGEDGYADTKTLYGHVGIAIVTTAKESHLRRSWEINIPMTIILITSSSSLWTIAVSL